MNETHKFCCWYCVEAPPKTFITFGSVLFIILAGFNIIFDIMIFTILGFLDNPNIGPKISTSISFISHVFVAGYSIWNFMLLKKNDFTRIRYFGVITSVILCISVIKLILEILLTFIRQGSLAKENKNFFSFFIPNFIIFSLIVLVCVWELSVAVKIVKICEEVLKEQEAKQKMDESSYTIENDYEKNADTEKKEFKEDSSFDEADINNPKKVDTSI